MSLSYGFYNGTDREYDAVQMSRLFDGIIQDGVFQSEGDAMVVLASGGMVVSASTGRAWFDSTWNLIDAPVAVTIPAADAVLDRIDAVVLEVNSDPLVRQNKIKVVQGTPAGSPVNPTLEDTAYVKQHALAYVYVAANVTEILGGDITNAVGTTETPFVTGILETLDATVLFAAWQADFDAWFAELQNELDENQASNLYNLIQKRGITRVIDSAIAAGTNTINVPVTELDDENKAEVFVSFTGTEPTGDITATFESNGGVTVTSSVNEPSEITFRVTVVIQGGGIV